MIIVARPPNFDAILAAFPDADKPGVIFAYGNDVFSPTAVDIPPALLAHEHVHCDRQSHSYLTTPEVWWTLYLNDPDFRYIEEMLAHAAEYRYFAQTVTDRNGRARLLMSTARRLIAPLYNYEPPRTLPQAMRDLQEIL